MLQTNNHPRIFRMVNGQRLALYPHSVSHISKIAPAGPEGRYALIVFDDGTRELVAHTTDEVREILESNE